VLGTADIFEFEEFRLDRRGEGLSRRDEHGVLVPLPVGPRGLDVLSALVERAGQLVTREEIMAAVWRQSVVENANLTVQIATLRRVLDQGRADGSCIQTVAVRGYRFLPTVTRIGDCDDRRGTTVSAGTPGHDAAQDPDAIQAAEHSPQTTELPPPRRRRQRLAFAGFALAAAALVVVGAAVLWTRLGSPPAPTTETASPQRPLNAPRLSIVVLPLANLSNDPDQQYFADGITEDLTTDLSRVADMLVISRNTAFTYRNKPIDAKQIGRELGVRYLLEGSVQRSGDRVRVTAQLIDAETDTHLWAERFDRDVGDLFPVQNEITSRIAVALHQELVSVEASRPAEHPDAQDYVLRARAAWNKPPTREKWAETISFLEQALAIDPGYVAAQGWLASALAARVLDQMSDSAEADVTRAERLAGEALAVTPRSAVAHYAKGHVLRARRLPEAAIPEYEAVLALNRNWVFAISALAQCKLATGSIDEVIPLLERAIRISPRDPSIVIFYNDIGAVHLLQSRTDEAIHWFESARSAAPAHAVPHASLAAAYGLKNDTERAATELAEARRLSSDNRYSSIARLRARATAVPKIRELFETTYYVGLRKAGMPEE
jgi:TolB-like protein/DNA-binding winged helix-turn-helix (wHTH) protein/Flp pilus assembly protein TadD